LSRCLANCQAAKQGAVNHTLLFGQLGEAQAINGVTGAGAGALGELRAKLSLPSIQGTTCKSEICLSMEAVYKVCSSSLFLIPILIQSCYHRIKHCQQYHHSKRISNPHTNSTTLTKASQSTLKMSSRSYTTTNISYGGPRTSSSSVSSRGSASYVDYRVPVSESSGKSSHQTTSSYSTTTTSSTGR
jgi:hypothetical protein